MYIHKTYTDERTNPLPNISIRISLYRNTQNSDTGIDKVFHVSSCIATVGLLTKAI